MNSTRKHSFWSMRAALVLAAIWPIFALGHNSLARGGDRTLVHEGIINAPVEKVWAMFVTDEGARKWMAPLVEIDLRIGGTIRASYHPESTLDDEHTIINRILAYEPNRMLAIRNEKAPDNFAHSDLFSQAWSITYFQPLGDAQTRLRMVGLGYGEGPEWDVLYNHFESGNEYLLGLLKQQFPSEAIDDPERVLPVLHRLVGGEWIHESTMADGSVFRVRSITEVGADGHSLISRSWLGNAAGMFDHGRTIMYRSPSSMGGGVRFFSIDEAGSLAQGAIRLIEPNRLVWDWHLTSVEDASRMFRVTMEFPHDDQYEFTLERRDDLGAWQQQVQSTFTRVDRAPAQFSGLGEKQASNSPTESDTAAIHADVRIDAAVDEVWRAWTTSEGIAGFFAPESEIDLRVGGSYELYFLRAPETDQRGTEGCFLLSYLPNEMLSFTWNAPPQFPNVRRMHTWVVLHFERAQGGVHVRLHHRGFDELKAEYPEHADEIDAVHAYFQRAWPHMLESLKRRFVEGPRWDADGRDRW